jgi:hypothetical protein
MVFIGDITNVLLQVRCKFERLMTILNRKVIDLSEKCETCELAIGKI